MASEWATIEDPKARRVGMQAYQSFKYIAWRKLASDVQQVTSSTTLGCVRKGKCKKAIQGARSLPICLLRGVVTCLCSALQMLVGAQGGQLVVRTASKGCLSTFLGGMSLGTDLARERSELTTVISKSHSSHAKMFVFFARKKKWGLGEVGT